MTREETAKIIYIVMSTFSTAYKNVSAERINALTMSWDAVFKDYSYKDVEQGLYIYMSTDTSGFPPQPGQIIDKIRMANTTEREVDALEAWVLVEKAISNSLYESVEEFKKLPPLCQKAVGRPEILREWAAMNTEQLQTVEQSHFIRAYDTVKRRENEYARLPMEVRNRIETVINQMPQLPDKVEVVEEERDFIPDFDMRKDIEELRKELA